MYAPIDPQWAWSPYEPSTRQPWNRARAAHLHRRAGLGATPQQLDSAVGRSPREVVAELVNTRADESFQLDMEAMARQLVAGGKPENLTAWWLYRLLYTPDPLLEQMTIFWHGHFATSAEKVVDAELMYDQNRLLREHALGDFAALAHAISRDPAMLIYLDSATNRKAHPNENYARELMELFCLGEGNYTERDIQELARCFTGWEVKRKRYRFNRYQHDFGEKLILGQRGEFDGDQGVDLVLAQEACPRFLAAKLVNYLVMDEPWPSDELIAPLAEQLRRDELRVAPTVQRILSSQLFFADSTLARKVRSPVQLAVGCLRSLGGTTDMHLLSAELDKLGQVLFYPPNVKGWEGGRAWVNSSTLLGRANMMNALLNSPRTRFGGGSLEDAFGSFGWETPQEQVEGLAELLLAVPLTAGVKNDLMAAAGRGPRDLLQIWATLPEMQLG